MAFPTSLTENVNLNIQPILASNQMMVLTMTTTTTKVRGPQALEVLLQPDSSVDLPEGLWEAMQV